MATDTTSKRGVVNDLIAVYMGQHQLKTVQAFAQHLELETDSVYQLILGTSPTLATLRRLADGLRVPLHVLVYRLEPGAYGADSVSVANPPN